MKISALDLAIETPFKAEGVAPIRLTNEMMEFLKICHDKHGIAGFEWDDEDPRLFSIILKNPRKE